MQSDRHLGKYLPIIRDSPVYPIIYDKDDHVLSFPPIINSERSKITLNTRNVFVDLTATDLTKLSIVTNIVVAMFSEYCDEPFTYVCTFIVDIVLKPACRTASSPSRLFTPMARS